MDLDTLLQLAASSLRLSTPLLLACLAGLFSERAGIFDIGLEGKMLAAAFFAAAISGYACIHFLLTWLRQRSLYLFAIYCVAFSLFNLALLWFGIV